MADEEPGRRAALAKLLPMQRADFAEIFKIMAGLSVMIRLLDPPLHEFLPKTERGFCGGGIDGPVDVRDRRRHGFAVPPGDEIHAVTQ